MQCSRHGRTGLGTALALVVLISLGLPGTGLGIGADASSQPSAMERLRRQEDARKADLARFAAAKRQNDAATMRDVRERAMLARPSIAPTAPVEPTTRPGVVDEFDWARPHSGSGPAWRRRAPCSRVSRSFVIQVGFAVSDAGEDPDPGALRGVRIRDRGQGIGPRTVIEPGSTT